MDAVESNPLWVTLSAQDCYLGSHDQQLQEMSTQIQQLTVAIAQLTTQCTTPTTAPAPPLPIHSLIAKPDKFSGDPGKCKGFLLQCYFYLIAQESLSNEAEVTQLISLLSDKALSWETAVWEQGGEPQTSYQHFITLFRCVFDHAPKGKDIGFHGR